MIIEHFGNITLVFGDCIDYLEGAPNSSFDLAIVDPPYGINAPNMAMGTNLSRTGDGYPGESVAKKLKKGRLNSGGGHFTGRNLTTMNCDWDTAIPSAEYFSELKRISNNQIIFGMNYFPLPPTRCVLCWDKKQPWENFSQFELAWTSFDSPAQLFRQSNRGGRNDEEKIHPTQKPVQLYKWILTKYTKQGDRILDTHGGSMSLAIACHDLGFELVIIEKDETYYNSSRQRLINHQKQLNLF